MTPDLISDRNFWILTGCLGLGTFLIRFSFLGLLGGRTLPDWVLSHLRYVAVAVLPALVTPMILWPAANDGHTDAARLVAAAAAFAAGIRFNVIAAILAGMGTLWLLQALLP